MPSDDSAAGGPYNVVEQVNREVAVYSRSGALQLGPVALDTWYGHTGDNVFDPHTIFEPQGKRFITIAEDGTSSSWVLRVSESNDATGSWCAYTFGALNSGATSVDFPLVASSTQYILLSIRESGGGNRLFATPKSTVEACQPAGGWVWTNVTNPTAGTVADTLVPVLDYNGSDTDSYIVNSYGGGGSHVSLYKFSNSASNPGLSGAQVSVPAYSVAPPAPQPNTNVVLATGNAAITQAVNYDYGMYAALTSGDSNGNAEVEWMRFDPNAQTLTASQFLYDPGLWYFYPSIGEAFNGTTGLTYSLASSSLYVSSAALGMDTSNNITSNVYIHQGSYSSPQTGSMTCSGSPCSRWADYTSTYTDPTDINNFWSASQTMANSSTFGTVIAFASA